MKYLNLDGVSKLWEKSVAKFALKSHTHPPATTSNNGFMSKYDKLKLNRLENTNYPHDNLLYDTNYYALSQTDSAGVYERYISTTAGNDSSENSQLLYSHLMGVKVTLSIEARNTSESSGLTTTPVADDRMPPSPSIMGARLAVYQAGNDTPIYTLDVPITTDDALQLTSDYKRFYATGTLPDVQIDKIRVYYGINCKTTTVGILAVRRPKLELGSQGTEWVQDNWGLIDAGAKKVNKSGDTMTGNLNIQGTYYPSFKVIPTNTTYGQKNLVFEGSYVGEASMSVWDTTDGQNRRMLVLRGANYMNTDGTYTMDNALMLRVAVNNNWTGYRVFHEGITTAIPIKNGGTGATTAEGALSSLGALPLTGGTLTGNLGISKDSYPSLSFENASGTALAYFQSDTSNGGYSNLNLTLAQSESVNVTFTFGTTGNLWCPGTVKTGLPIDVTYGGTGSGIRAEAAGNLLIDPDIVSDADTIIHLGHYATSTTTVNIPFQTYGVLTVMRANQGIVQFWSSTEDSKTTLYMRKKINTQDFGSWYKILGNDVPVPLSSGGTGGTTLNEAQSTLFSGTYVADGTDLSSLAPGIHGLLNDTTTDMHAPETAWSPIMFVFGSQGSTTGSDGYPVGTYFQGFLNWEGELWIRRRKWDGWGDWMKMYSTKNVVYSSTEPSNPTTGTIWLKPI